MNKNLRKLSSVFHEKWYLSHHFTWQYWMTTNNLAHSVTFVPNNRGFDSFLGYYSGKEDYYYHNRSYDGLYGWKLLNCESCREIDLLMLLIVLINVSWCLKQVLFNPERKTEYIRCFFKLLTALIHYEMVIMNDKLDDNQRKIFIAKPCIFTWFNYFVNNMYIKVTPMYWLQL